MPIGPSLPPHLAYLSSRPSRSPSPASGSETDDFGPALPPHLAAARDIAGPSRPPQIPSPPTNPTYLDEEDDDDEIGPRPVGAAIEERSAVQEFIEREERWAREREEAKKPKKMEREEWMLVPPTSGVLSAVDPLRKRPTTFSKNTTAPQTDSSVWTETPQEKAQRIADEVAGVKRTKDPAKLGAGRVGEEDDMERARKRQRDRDIKDGVERLTKDTRGQSLLDQHSKKLKSGEKDADAPAIWDHDRDMGITGRLMSDQERSAKIKDARGLNDRFGHSKRGAYDI